MKRALRRLWGSLRLSWGSPSSESDAVRAVRAHYWLSVHGFYWRDELRYILSGGGMQGRPNYTTR